MVTYRIKVRKTTYLWGGQGVSDKISSHLYLFFRVAETAEQVRFGTRRPDGKLAEKGVLNAGEAFTVRLDDITGVWASIAEPKDSFVDCAIIAEDKD